MKNFLIPFFTFLFGFTAPCLAVNAFPGIIPFTQPDGEEIEIRMVGNELNHIVYSTDGFPLLMNENGFYVFAELDANENVIPSDITVTNLPNRSTETAKRLQMIDKDAVVYNLQKQQEEIRRSKRRGQGLIDTGYPTLGQQKALVILVEFSDVEFSMPDPEDYYTRMLNQEGFSDNGGTGSAREYFIENSCGKFIPSFDVYGPVKLSGDVSYYGDNDRWGYDLKPQLMAIEACSLLDDRIDFTLYDCNGDGIIDNVFFYYAGYGENDGGGTKTIWPHSTKLSLVFDEKFIYDGVELDRYACSNELHSPRRNGLPDGIGTFCHEFGHVLGLPDLYATTFVNVETPGNWDLMDNGSYTNSGNTPPCLSSFERYALDWLDPVELTPSEVSLLPLHTSNTALIYRCENPNEYFLFENRQCDGFDTFLPGHGMLIWLINYNKRQWEENIVNNYFTQQGVDLIEADNKAGSGSRDGDPFPGTSQVTEFSSRTVPTFRGKTQPAIPLGLTNIAESEDGVISFTVIDFSAPETGGVTSLPDNCAQDDSSRFDLHGNVIRNNDQYKGIYIQNGEKRISR